MSATTKSVGKSSRIRRRRYVSTRSSRSQGRSGIRSTLLGDEDLPEAELAEARVDRGGRDAPDPWLRQPLAGVVIEPGHRSFLREQAGRLQVGRGRARFVRILVRLLGEPVEFGVRPPGAAQRAAVEDRGQPVLLMEDVRAP